MAWYNNTPVNRSPKKDYGKRQWRKWASSATRRQQRELAIEEQQPIRTPNTYVERSQP